MHCGKCLKVCPNKALH
ncbi:4Fe-4S binding protein [Anaerobutyricum soehngenii]|nr:4Fe-4S binding protein [Anaerobutyricum hallii]